MDQNYRKLPVERITLDGYLTDPGLLEVEHAMTDHSEESVYLVDGGEGETLGLSLITHVSEISRVPVADLPGELLEELPAVAPQGDSCLKERDERGR